MKKLNEKGLTLIELLVVIVIIVIISLLVIPSVINMLMEKIKMRSIKIMKIYL